MFTTKTSRASYTWSEALSKPCYRIRTQIGKAVCRFLQHFWPEQLNGMSRFHYKRLVTKYQTLKQHTHALETENGVLKEELEKERAAKEELEAKGARLEQLCAEDPLTGLHNRRGLDERFAATIGSLTRAIRHDRDKKEHRKLPPIALIMIDLDNFKPVNDIIGHAEGDRVLRVIGELMTECFAHRPEDIIARNGGDEFVVILPRATSKGASELADAFLTAVHTDPRLQFPGHGIAVTASIGVAATTLIAGRTVEDTMAILNKDADSALHSAKQNGRNNIVRYDQLV